MLSLKRLKIALFIFLLGASAQGRASGTSPSWEPTKTWVVVVGVLEWQHGETWDSFPKEERKDVELVRFFKQAGVPQNQILYLQDREATRARIERSMAQLLAGAKEDDLLIFYYEGHGAQDDFGTTYFANYDADDKLAQSAWSLPSIFRLIENNFRGSRALLTADCCYSGALADEAGRRKSSISYAVLTSARPDSLSTENWTFTNCLLQGFRGDAKVDRNRDGQILLTELARYTRTQMWTLEGQLPTFVTTREFLPEMKLSEVARSSTPHPRVHLEVEWEGTWYPARILEASGGQYKIHYLGYGVEWDEWVSAARMRYAEN